MNRLLSLLVAVLGVLMPARAASLVSAAPTNPASATAAGSSSNPVLSGDGRRVFFLSHARNLRTNAPHHDGLQLYVRDLITETTTLVSALTNGQPADVDYLRFSVSSNGQFVAFTSAADGLVAADANLRPDVFVRDVLSNTTRVVTVAYFGAISSQHSGTNVSAPLISADGRFVFFESSATDLTWEGEWDNNQSADIYRRDLQSNVTMLVTRHYYSPPQTINAGSVLSGITPDGNRLVFITAASNVGYGILNSQGDVYVRDFRSNDVPVRASTSISFPNGYRCSRAVISEDGRFVAFVVAPLYEPFIETVLYVRDLQAAAPLAIATNVTSTPQISADGRFVLFEQETNIFRFDTLTLTNELVNITPDGPATNGVARDAAMTADGTLVLFNSDTPGLTAHAAIGQQLYARDMAAGVTRLVIVATNGTPSLEQKLPVAYSVTPDGARVAFDSVASDLVPGDLNRASDVFMRNGPNDTTRLVSQNAAGGVSSVGRAHAFMDSDCVSTNGRWVVFTGYDNEFLPGDTNSRPDVFIRDLVTGAFTSPGFSTNAAVAPSISANGRYVVYLRREPVEAGQLAGGNVMRFDRETAQEEFVSSSTTSVQPAISGDGRWIAFLSNTVLFARDMLAATNHVIGSAEPSLGRDATITPDGARVLFISTAALTPGATGGRNLFAWHTMHRTNALISLYEGNAGAGGAFAVSRNSRFVAYSGPSSFELFRFDLLAGTNQFLRFNARQPAISSDGTLVACYNLQSPAGLLIFNAATGEEFPLLTNNATAGTPLLSPDGRWVVQARRARLWVWDRLLRTNYVIDSVLPGGNAAVGTTSAALAADGRTVIFHTAAGPLVPGDDHDQLDVFLHRLGGGDADADGLDDDWEVAYFGNLLRTGADDYDGDGANDRAEFLAGTDPKITGSVLRVLSVSSPVNGGRYLFWQGNPARRYRIEFKDDLGATNWNSLDSLELSTSWNGSTATAHDYSAGSSSNRYYRIVLLP